jgi:hypothetical protein
VSLSSGLVGNFCHSFGGEMLIHPCVGYCTIVSMGISSWIFLQDAKPLLHKVGGSLTVCVGDGERDGFWTIRTPETWLRILLRTHLEMPVLTDQPWR